ncbi:MAG TPA: NYN domain-containing protein [Steroidobacteraceae bacterium]|jgi:uncharacterized LabA/DUF88 family protein|nr:NYN domain-containing protein [Steroidobacteraceae bacterium]
MESSACVFVDGENLRHSLLGAFAEEGLLETNDYLPATANWSDFFDWVVEAATGGSHHRLRAYWFVTQEIDCFPYGLNRLVRPENRDKLRTILSRHKPFRDALKGLKDTALETAMGEQVEHLRRSQQRIESRFKGWNTVQNGIALKHRAVEFRRSGAISYNLFEERFGQEKCVDVRLACDMIMLRGIYDTAIIVSGDQDYVPAAQILKDSGKTVINVAFQKRNGELLPGGARRLNIVMDASLSVPYGTLRDLMGFGATQIPRAA